VLQECRTTSLAQPAELHNLVGAYQGQYTKATKEPVGLTSIDIRRPDGVTLLPWSNGRIIITIINNEFHNDVVAFQEDCKAAVTQLLLY